MTEGQLLFLAGLALAIPLGIIASVIHHRLERRLDARTAKKSAKRAARNAKFEADAQRLAKSSTERYIRHLHGIIKALTIGGVVLMAIGLRQVLLLSWDIGGVGGQVFNGLFWGVVAFAGLMASNQLADVMVLDQRVRQIREDVLASGPPSTSQTSAHEHKRPGI